MRMNIAIGETPSETRVTDLEGNEVRGITGMDVRIRPDALPEAHCTFLLEGEATAVVPTISDEHLRELAESKGYELVPLEAGGQ